MRFSTYAKCGQCGQRSLIINAVNVVTLYVMQSIRLVCFTLGSKHLGLKPLELNHLGLNHLGVNHLGLNYLRLNHLEFFYFNFALSVDQG